ncbi:MAG: aminotransferase class I/II-fold pyridoxal phosphate-dependent enzyme [Thermoguttaceae bacterium]
MHLDQLPGTFFGPSTLVELVRHRARCQAKDVAFTYLVDGENEQVHLTYEELDRQARAIGAWLESRGLGGERALLLYPAGLEFIAGFFGCLYAGVVAVPVYPPRRNRSLMRIQAIADDAQAKVALTTDAVLARVEGLIDETPHLKQLTWLDTCHVPAGMDQQWQMPDVHGETLAFLQYTSGSTGTPKGVVLSHANLAHNSALIAYAFEHTRSGTGVFWLPSYHDMGLIGGILQPLYVGRPNVLMSPITFLQKPLRWLSAISRFGGTTSGGPNFAYDLCVRKITPEQRKTLDLSTWKVAFNGAEPVRAETLDRFLEAFGPCGFRREAFYPCFGLAEATLIVSGGQVFRPPIVRQFDAAALSADMVVEVPEGRAGARALVGCGETLPDQTIVIADPETRSTCPPGRIGEIWVCGPSIAQGYWQQPEASEAVFRATLADTGAGPFLRTGDLGFMLDGELFVTGRLKDLIIVRGVNFYPQDIEWTAERSFARLRPDCGAAFTIEQDGRERLVLVFEIERHKQGRFDHVFQAMLRAVARDHDLSVDVIVLVRAGSIPKTSSGKIQRHACRRGYLEGSLQVVARWEADGPPPAASPTRRARAEPAPAPPAAASGNGDQVAPGASAPPGALAAAGPATPAKPTPPRSASPGGAARRIHAANVVMEEIRRVAKDRSAGMTLDSPIAEAGLDSMERMEILATLEERFGGRFPPQILPELETTRQVIAAVEQYLGSEPRPEAAGAAAGEIPPEHYRIDLFPEYLQLRQRLELMQNPEVGNPFFSVHEGITNDRTVIDGRELISFATFNYLGTAGDPLVSQAAKAAIDRYGTSVSASRLVSGEKTLHGELERALADFLGTEATVVLPSGHHTNETVIGHMVGPGDLVLHDVLAHNSIFQGAMLSGARLRAFPHNDFQAADRLLEQFRHGYRRALVAIEGVYSMDGDVPDLPRFVEIRKRHKALLMIDEAHSIGVLGARGRGIGEHFGVPPSDVDIWMGTISKALGSCGGYIAGSRELVEYLKYTLPGFVFATGISPPAAAAALAALGIVQSQPERIARLRENARLFLALAQERGLNTGTSHHTPVVPVIVGNSLVCLRLSRAMRARGVNVQPIVHPAVEESAARLRFFITSLHTERQIRYTADALAEEWEKIRVHAPLGAGAESLPSSGFVTR